MARCNSCSAPLPANSNRCAYCMVRNDVDLQGKYDYSVEEQQSDRICPTCESKMTTIGIKFDDTLYIERCDSCYGLFFDPGELETLMDKSISGVFDVNREQMSNINRDRYQRENKIVYKKCPECRAFMHRKNFGHKSGVVIDKCNTHGIWLDSGEITHLMEWRKAGGQMLHEEMQQQQPSDVQKAQISAEKLRNLNQIKNNSYRESNYADDDLVNMISGLLGRLFR